MVRSVDQEIIDLGSRKTAKTASDDYDELEFVIQLAISDWCLTGKHRYYFIATRTHTPDQLSWPRPGGGVALRAMTPSLLASNGNLA